MPSPIPLLDTNILSERDQADMLIAATAQVHQLTLVTHNLRHFEGCEIPLFDPFESPG
jgi:predicted nucleic acid-binding protein